MSSFGGKVALVTGAGSGIGRAIAIEFAARGARVLVADVNDAGAQETVALCEGDAITHVADISDPGAVDAMVQAAVDQWGSLDCAVNNAGISPVPKPFTDHSLEDWQRTIDINLTGVFLCMQHEIRRFVAQGEGGAIVNMSSGAGIVAAPGQPQYTAAKHGVLGLTKQAAQEYGRAGIRVNAVLPGNTETPMMRVYLDSSPVVEERMKKIVPLGRHATTNELAQAAVWLCSGEASFVSGSSLVVDGGMIGR